MKNLTHSVREHLREAIFQSLSGPSRGELVMSDILLSEPRDLSHGDYTTNISFVLGKRFQVPPHSLAEKIAAAVSRKKIPGLSSAAAEGGFVNFTFSGDFFAGEISGILASGKNFGRGVSLKGKRVLVEFTDPNPLKEFHIGHLMSNAVGESIARLIESQGAEVKRACYQGDVGLHVAKAIWGFAKTNDWRSAYSTGAAAYEKEGTAKKEIEETNLKIYNRSDPSLNKIYDEGRERSLKDFETIYKRLGTKFDYYFFESEVAGIGKEIVERNLGTVFAKSEGAVVFRGEEQDTSLHTRVFLNKDGLPTYEAKELGLALAKAEKYPCDISISVTGNEVNEYFRVVLKAMSLVLPEIAPKIIHLSHGMLRLPSGKMSSRTGNIVTAESLLDAVEAMVHERLEARELMTDEKNKIAEIVAVGAVKYSILRQAIGGNIIYDFEKSISFEGDSGPYLQYAHTRALSVLRKAAESGLVPAPVRPAGEKVSELERLLIHFPEVVETAANDRASHQVATYLIRLAGVFNNYYAENKIIAAGAAAPYRLALTKAFAVTMENGLSILGIKAPERM